jgi:hypothetical protein
VDGGRRRAGVGAPPVSDRDDLAPLVALAELGVWIRNRDEVGQSGLGPPRRHALHIDRFDLPVASGRRVDVELDVALEDHEALEEVIADPGVLANVVSTRDAVRLLADRVGPPRTRSLPLRLVAVA